MIFSIPIRNEMRRRIVKEAGIISEKAIQFENMPPLTDKSIWIRETWIGGEEHPATNAATRQIAIVEYDIFVGLNTSSDNALIIGNQIEEEFDLVNPAKAAIALSGWTGLSAVVYKTGEGTPQSDDTWYWLPILLYIRIDAKNAKYGA